MRAKTRPAPILDSATDVWGGQWEVRERRSTEQGFEILLGWPMGAVRGKGGAGAAGVIVTIELLHHLEKNRRSVGNLRLPIGASSIKRLRRLLGHHRQIDAGTWWMDRAADLADLTAEAFAAKHGRLPGTVINARHALYGPKLRPAGWWRAEDVAAILLSDAPTAHIADKLNIAVGSVRRLRAALRKDTQGGAGAA